MKSVIGKYHNLINAILFVKIVYYSGIIDNKHYIISSWDNFFNELKKLENNIVQYMREALGKSYLFRIPDEEKGMKVYVSLMEDTLQMLVSLPTASFSSAISGHHKNIPHCFDEKEQETIKRILLTSDGKNNTIQYGLENSACRIIYVMKDSAVTMKEIMNLKIVVDYLKHFYKMGKDK